MHVDTFKAGMDGAKKNIIKELSEGEEILGTYLFVVTSDKSGFVQVSSDDAESVLGAINQKIIRAALTPYREVIMDIAILGSNSRIELEGKATIGDLASTISGADKFEVVKAEESNE